MDLGGYLDVGKGKKNQVVTRMYGRILFVILYEKTMSTYILHICIQIYLYNISK